MVEQKPGSGRIKRLKESLYSRTNPYSVERSRSSVSEVVHDVQDDWSTPEESSDMPQKKKKSPLSLFLIFSIIFFTGAAAFAAVVIFGGGNTVSPKNLDIKVFGPVSVAGGDELIFDVVVENHNPIDLATTDLLIEFPEGSRAVGEGGKELVRFTKSLGALRSGESVRTNVHVVLFGEKDSIASIPITVEYKAEGLNTLASKKHNFEITIASSPIILNIEYPKEVISNQEISFVVDLSSNSDTVIEDLLFTAEYPFGFTFVSATPAPDFDDTVWNIGNLDAREEQKIVIRGILEGENNEERVFRFASGVAEVNDAKKIETAFLNTYALVNLNKAFLSVGLDLGGGFGKGDVALGVLERSAGVIAWTNNLGSSLHNIRAEVDFRGSAFDQSSVSANSSGFFRSLDNTILWNKQGESLDPGEGESVGFSFRSVDIERLFSNPEILVTARVYAEAPDEAGFSEELVGEVSRVVKITAKPQFTSRITHFTGPIIAIGPVPPRVDQATEYVVTWSLANTFNDIGNTEIRAKLPTYVSWTNQVSSGSGDISFDEKTNEAVWKLPRIQASATRELYEASFKISFTPSLSQLNQTPTLVLSPRFSAEDLFTGARISGTLSPLTTRLSTDPLFTQGDDKVVR